MLLHLDKAFPIVCNLVAQSEESRRYKDAVVKAAQEVLLGCLRETGSTVALRSFTWL